jgi:hypothetical protein
MSILLPHHPPALAVLIFALGLGACAATSPDDPETSLTSQGLVSCTNDCDCGFGAYCWAGSCMPDFGPFFECYCAARDCANYKLPHICSGGSCVPSTGCNNDCDCPPRNWCTAGACEPDEFGPPLECYCAYRDCGVDQYCAAGSCTDI